MLFSGCGDGAGTTPESHGQKEGFENLAPALGVTRAAFSGGAEKDHVRSSLGQGICWTDYDGDGDVDLLVPGGAREVLPDYRGRSDVLEPTRLYRHDFGERFVEVGGAAGLMVDDWTLGCAVADVDADGFEDLLLTTATSHDRLFRSRGDGTYSDASEGLYGAPAGLSTGAVFVDLDADSDLDLFVARYLDESRPPAPEGCVWKGVPVMCGPKGFPQVAGLLLLNRGDGNFELAGQASGLADHTGYGLGAIALDADEDGDQDLFVTNDSSPNHLFLNRGDATFDEVGLAAGVALSDAGKSQAGMGVDAADLDGDGRLDLVVTNFSDDVHNFYRNQGGALFQEWSHRSGLAAASFALLGWSVLAEDFDLDGDLDLFVANGHVYPQVDGHDPNTTYLQPMTLLFNDGRGGWTDAAARGGPVFAQPIAGRGAAVADLDRDGAPDLAVARDGAPPLVLRNRLRTGGRGWLRVHLLAPDGNRQGLGTRVELHAGNRRQVREIRHSRGYLSSSEAVAAFGGVVSEVEELRIHWPDGRVQLLRRLPANRHVLLTPSVARRGA